MRLLINGEEVSYSLENEKTLGEVVRGVQGWLNASGFLVTDLAADTRDLLASPEQEWSPQPVELTRELAVKAAHTGDMRIEHWSTVQAWLGMLADELAAPGPVPQGPADLDVLGELVAGLPQTLESFKANPFLPPGSDLAVRFAALFAGVPAAEIRRWPAEKTAQAALVLAELRARIASRLAAAHQPREAAARCVATLTGLLGSLSEVSVMLQTGRDRAGHGRRHRFHRCGAIPRRPAPVPAPGRGTGPPGLRAHPGAARADEGLRHEGRDPHRGSPRVRDCASHEAHHSPDREGSMILLQFSLQSLKGGEYTGPGLYLYFGIAVAAVAVLILVGSLVARRSRPRSATDAAQYSSTQFKKAGRALGLTPPQVDMLENLVRACKVKQPFLVFTSAGLLDDTLKKGLYSLDSSRDLIGGGTGEAPLAHFPDQADMERNARKGASLGSTTSLKPGQPLTITVEGSSPFASKVISNMKDFLTVAAPARPAGADTRWMRGTLLSVYLWRENDAGYSFPSKILGYDTVKGVPSVLIQHAKTLRREQRRRSRRRELMRPCFYYPILITETGEGRKAERKAVVERDKRTLGTVVDLSAGGCAVQTLNPFEKGKLVMLEFDIDRRAPIRAFGKVMHTAPARRARRESCTSCSRGSPAST